MVFGSIVDETNNANKQITLFGKTFKEIQNDIKSSDTKGLAKITGALKSTGAQAVATEIKVAALNAALSFGLSLAVSLLVQGIGKLVDKLFVTEEELNEVRQNSIDTSNALRDSTESFVQEAESIEELVAQYKQIALSIDTTVDARDKLSQIQTDLIDKFGEEAKGLDLVNGKYDEQLQKIDELSKAQYEQWRIENADKIKEAEKVIGYNVGWAYEDENGKLSEQVEGANQVYLKGWVDHADDLAASLYKIEGVSEDIQDIYQNIAGIDFVDGFFSNDIFLSGTVEDAKNQLEQLIQAYSQLENVDRGTLAKLTKQYNYLNTELKNAEYYISEIRKFEAPNIEVVGEISKENINKLNTLFTAVEETRTKWFESMNEIESSFGKTVDTMTSALQTLANGDGLSSADFWKLMELDTDKIITDISMVNGKYVLNQEQLIKLKDQYINQQIESLKIANEELLTKRKELTTTIEQAKAELSILGARGMSNSAYREEYKAASDAIKKGEKNLAEYDEQVRRNNILLNEWKNKLGNVVDYTEVATQKQKALNDEIKKLNDEIKDLDSEIDARLKAQEHVIDGIISEHEDELAVLESEKEALEGELEALNEQKSAIEEIIQNYDTVNSLVQKTLDKEVDALEEQKKAIEDTYNKRIEALKAENEEREDALEYAQKLADLENARNNKRRVRDETRGWRYEAVKEDVLKAENSLADYENSQAVKALEKERDSQTELIDNIIKEKEKYADLWKDISNEIQTEEDELLAEEILGADWREKIANGDIEIMEKFRTQYRNHNIELKRITDSEIELKEAAIKAKDEEIKSKQEQIKVWQDYKTEIQNAVKDAKDSQDDYLKYIDDVKINENSNLTERGNNLEGFKTRINGIMDEIGTKQYIVDNLTSTLDNISGGDYDYNLTVNGLDELKQAAAAAAVVATTAGKVSSSTMLGGVTAGVGAAAMGGMFSQTADDIVDVVNQVMSSITGFSSGGVNDNTGLQMLHGTKQRSEVIFNAKDAAKLYDFIHQTPNLVTSMLQQAKLNGLSDFTKTNNTTNSSVNINSINVYANNPSELSRGLDREIDQYFQNKLTQNYTKR